MVVEVQPLLLILIVWHKIVCMAESIGMIAAPVGIGKFEHARAERSRGSRLAAIEMSIYWSYAGNEM